MAVLSTKNGSVCRGWRYYQAWNRHSEGGGQKTEDGKQIADVGLGIANRLDSRLCGNDKD